MVPYYDYALDTILDLESQHADSLTDEQHEARETGHAGLPCIHAPGKPFGIQRAVGPRRSLRLRRRCSTASSMRASSSPRGAWRVCWRSTRRCSLDGAPGCSVGASHACRLGRATSRTRPRVTGRRARRRVGRHAAGPAPTPCLTHALASALPAVKLYCPKCQDLFYPRSRFQGSVDGAYFGTTFPHLFLMTYPSLRPPPPMVRRLPVAHAPPFAATRRVA